MSYEQIDSKLTTCEYFFGVKKEVLDSMVLKSIIETRDPSFFYSIRVKLINLKLRELLEERGVSDSRVTKLYRHKEKWEKRQKEE